MTTAAGVKSFVTRGYDRAGARFAASADTLIYAYLARPLADALVGAKGPVLDVASGTGALGRLLDDVVACDLSTGQLRHNSLSRKVRADGEHLPFAGGAFAASGCAFGINHFPDPQAGVVEMARVAPVVGVVVWARPDREEFRPKAIMAEVIARHGGLSDEWQAIRHLEEAVGSEAAVGRLLAGAGLDPTVTTLQIELPWPGAAAYVEYRIAMDLVKGFAGDLEAVTRDAVAAIDSLPADQLSYRPHIVLGIGRRQRRVTMAPATFSKRSR